MESLAHLPPFPTFSLPLFVSSFLDLFLTFPLYLSLFVSLCRIREQNAIRTRAPADVGNQALR